MLVVAPASGISRLDWLTNAEGDARADAAERAEELAEAAATEDVEAKVGDSDPVQATRREARIPPSSGSRCRSAISLYRTSGDLQLHKSRIQDRLIK